MSMEWFGCVKTPYEKLSDMVELANKISEREFENLICYITVRLKKVLELPVLRYKELDEQKQKKFITSLNRVFLHIISVRKESLVRYLSFRMLPKIEQESILALKTCISNEDEKAFVDLIMDTFFLQSRLLNYEEEKIFEDVFEMLSVEHLITFIPSENGTFVKWNRTAMTDETAKWLYENYPAYEFHTGNDSDFYSAIPAELSDMLNGTDEFDSLSQRISECAINIDNSEISKIIKNVEYVVGCYFANRKRNEITRAINGHTTDAASGLSFPLIGNSILNDAEQVLEHAIYRCRDSEKLNNIENISTSDT